MIILGLDPGTATTGYGIIKVTGNEKQGIRGKAKCLDFDCILTDNNDRFSLRLKNLSKELRKIVKKYNPDICAMETLFFFVNRKTAIKVSQAAGVVLYTLEQCRVPVVEFSPQEVKKSLTGNGRAEKLDVQKRIKRVLNLKEVPRSNDAADALAIAYHCALRYTTDKSPDKN